MIQKLEGNSQPHALVPRFREDECVMHRLDTHSHGGGWGMAGRTVASKDSLALILGSCDYRRLHGKGNWVADTVKVVDCLLSHIIQMSPG